VITVSDTRTLESDLGGARIVEHLQQANHQVIDRRIVADEGPQIETALLQLCEVPQIDAVLLTGGTGISPRDVTYDTVRPLLTRELPGYGELFRMLSFQQVGPACMLSRTIGGIIGRIIVLTMPGSPKAVDLAMQRLILPELAHLVDQARRS
jgi:molybdenum cofactor biosynthesis protein B